MKLNITPGKDHAAKEAAQARRVIKNQKRLDNVKKGGYKVVAKIS